MTPDYLNPLRPFGSIRSPPVSDRLQEHRKPDAYRTNSGVLQRVLATSVPSLVSLTRFKVRLLDPQKRRFSNFGKVLWLPSVGTYLKVKVSECQGQMDSVWTRKSQCFQWYKPYVCVTVSVSTRNLWTCMGLFDPNGLPGFWTFCSALPVWGGNSNRCRPFGGSWTPCFSSPY